MNYKKINKKKLFGVINLLLGIILICVGLFATKPKDSKISDISLDQQIQGVETSSTTQRVNNIPSDKVPLEEGTNTKQDSIIFSVDGKTLNLNFNEGDTLEKVIKVSTDKGLININGENFPGLGFFVQSINGIEQGNGYSWIYYINGKKATVGVSSYKLKIGDLIEWKYEKNY